jgi:hypothetical protein
MKKYVMAGACTVALIVLGGVVWLEAAPASPTRAPLITPVPRSQVVRAPAASEASPTPSAASGEAVPSKNPSPASVPANNLGGSAPIASPANAAPAVGTLIAVPSAILVNTTTQITFTAQIADPSLLPGGVNLLEVDATGKTISILGLMYDDGTHGDAVGGDHTFTATVAVNDSTTGAVTFEASAAFKGILKRVQSNPCAVSIWGPVTGGGLTFALPAQFDNPIVTSQSSGQSQTVTVTHPEGSGPVEEFSFDISPLAPSTSLTGWFAEALDPTGELLNTGVYVLQTVGGRQFIVQVQPLPDDYLDENGPIPSYFELLPSNQVVSISPSADNDLDQLGMPDDATHSYQLNILLTLHSS